MVERRWRTAAQVRHSLVADSIVGRWSTGSFAADAPMRYHGRPGQSPVSQHLGEHPRSFARIGGRGVPRLREAETCPGAFPSGTEFQGEGRTFNPNTPRNISQSASRSGSKPGGKRENRERDRAGAMPGSSTKRGNASSERTTPICRISTRTPDDTTQVVERRNWGEAYVEDILPDCRPRGRC